jgi:hypothetical protein
MVRHLVSAMVVATCPWLALHANAAPQVHRSASAGCESLSGLRLPDIRITSATAIAGPVPKSPVTVPHCRIRGVVGSEIQFEVLLPDDWNGRFAMGGGGGFAGSIDNAAAGVVNGGFAAASTDTGHQADGVDAAWALGDLERQVNYGYLGVHRTAEAAKAIIRSYYGQDASHTYFLGCSNGGREALMEAQRFPADFDGVMAGAPAYDFTSIAASFMHHAQVTFPDPHHLEASTISDDALKTVATAALEACDGLDGVRDGVIGDPARCSFSVDQVRPCSGDVASAGCLTTRERAAIEAIYAPTVDRDGEVYPGQPPGDEADDGGWRLWITGVEPRHLAGSHGTMPSLQFGFATGFFKYFVFSDANWDYSHYDVANARRDTRAPGTFLNADDPNLSKFKAHGGKLILWHGWSDPALNAKSTIRYYEQVQAIDPDVRDFARLFLMPGVLHCGGGSGPDQVDWLPALVNWVERGQPPNRLTASKHGEGEAIVRTRPLCPYPLEAAYNGTGSTDDEANFTCKPR